MRTRLSIVCLSLLLLGGCKTQNAEKESPSSDGNFFTGKAKIVVLERYKGSSALAKPDEVVVSRFIVPNDGITLDESLAARLHRRFSSDDDSTPQVLGRHIQDAFSNAITSDLRKTGIPVRRPYAEGSGRGHVKLVVSGEFDTINEGNETKRILIGFGRGASDIRTGVTIALVSKDESTVILQFQMDSESNRLPGSAVGGPGSLAVGSAGSAIGDRGSKVEADARRLGKLVAKQIQALMLKQKWIEVPGKDVTPAAANRVSSSSATSAAN